MEAGKRNIIVQQGSTFSKVLVLTDSLDAAIDLTGCTVRASMRPHYDSAEKADFVMTITDALAGEVTWVMSAANTALLNALDDEDWVYDIEVVFADTSVQRILQGSATISKEATR